MSKAAENTLKPRDEIKRDFCRSAATEQLFKDRQKMKEEGKFEAKRMTNKIKTKKSIFKDREAHYTKHFEEEIWQDIQMAKASYLPKHTRLKKRHYCENYRESRFISGSL